MKRYLIIHEINDVYSADEITKTIKEGYNYGELNIIRIRDLKRFCGREFLDNLVSNEEFWIPLGEWED